MSGGLASCDLTKIFSLKSLREISEEEEHDSYELVSECSFPDFGAHLFQRAALTHVCGELRAHVHQALTTISDTPSVIVAGRMWSVWDKVIEECSNGLYLATNVGTVLKSIQKEEDIESNLFPKEPSKLPQLRAPDEKLIGNAFLMEVGVKTGLSIVFSMLKQAWSQLAWQKQLEEVLSQSASLPVEFPPAVSLPNMVLKSVLDVLSGIPSMSLSNPKTISSFGQTCLDQSTEFLRWVIRPASLVDAEGKRLALQIMLSICAQHGSLVHFLEWVESTLVLLVGYQGVGVTTSPPTLEIGYCRSLLNEIRTKAVSNRAPIHSA